MTHIREIEATDSMDWKFFYEGARGDYPNWSHLLWSLLHDAMNEIPCNTCRDEGIDLMRAFHDLINFETGKPLKYESNFFHMAKRYGDAAEHVKAQKALEIEV